jgi:hypothetical protein
VTPADPVASFSAIASELVSEPGVEEGTGFGTNPGLRVGGKIFAILQREALVLKLPAERCDAIVAAGGAEYFEIGTRQMTEWVSVKPDSGHDWNALAREALAFLAAP